MKNLVKKWMLISLGVGLIPVMLLGVTPGGGEFSPIILVLSFVVGLVGAMVHVNLYAFTRGTKEQQSSALGFSALSIFLVAALIYIDFRCELKEEYALDTVHKYIQSNPELEKQYLGKVKFDKDNCVCTFEYKSQTEHFTITVTEYGDMYFSQH